MMHSENKLIIRSSVTLLLIAISIFPVMGSTYSDEEENRPLCASRNDSCCVGRQDECYVGYFGGVCYCDKFCINTHSPGLEDCCPDFFETCGVSPPRVTPTLPPTRVCSIYRQSIEENEWAKVNCKWCKCRWNGRSMELECLDGSLDNCLVQPAMINEINNDFDRFGWRARNYSKFWGRFTDEGFDRRLGTYSPLKKVLKMFPIRLHYNISDLPKYFDSRERWPNMIENPRDQGWCNASWALSTAAVASDRTKIMLHWHRPLNTRLSAQHLLSCSTDLYTPDQPAQTNKKRVDGCLGGYLTTSWHFIRKYGLVNETCFPWVGTNLSCPFPRSRNLFETSCGCTPPVTQSRYSKVTPVYRIGGEEDIMYEMTTSGPVQAIMRVYQDFFVYSNGIYSCGTDVARRSGRYGLQGVRIIGWGEERTRYGHKVKYWIAANSWGEWWGEKGYFRIRKGCNDCGIEDFVIAAWANENPRLEVDTQGQRKRRNKKRHCLN